MLWSLDETALDLFARRPAKGFRTGLRFVDDATSSAATGGDRGARAATGDGFQPRQVIEVCGSSATPKLLVLLHAVAAFLIKRLDDLGDREADSSEHATSTLSSANERVFLFDHEFEADAHQLLHVLLEKLQTRIPDSKQRHDAARRAMDRVVMFNCNDTFQCLATLNQLHFELMDAPTTPLLLAFNCISSFHSIDRMIAKSVGDGLALSEQVFIFLKQFSRHHSPIILAAKEIPVSARNGWESSEFLPSSWSSQVSKRILLRPVPPQTHKRDPSELKAKVAANMTLFEAKCIVRGESRVYSCRINGSAIDVVDQ
ncbi:hypothetical protein Gpo141_00005830 [Globisporangium polare]